MRGLVRDWPMVQHALKSDQALCSYLALQDSGKTVDAIMLRPQEGGRIFYSADMAGFNFLRNRVPVGAALEQLTRYAQFPYPPAVVV